MFLVALALEVRYARRMVSFGAQSSVDVVPGFMPASREHRTRTHCGVVFASPGRESTRMAKVEVARPTNESVWAGLFITLTIVLGCAVEAV